MLERFLKENSWSVSGEAVKIFLNRATPIVSAPNPLKAFFQDSFTILILYGVKVTSSSSA